VDYKFSVQKSTICHTSFNQKTTPLIARLPCHVFMICSDSLRCC